MGGGGGGDCRGGGGGAGGYVGGSWASKYLHSSESHWLGFTKMGSHFPATTSHMLSFDLPSPLVTWSYVKAVEQAVGDSV